MNKLSGTAQGFVDFYVNGAGPCGVLYCTKMQGPNEYVDKVATINDDGDLVTLWTITNNVTDAVWLTMGPAYPDSLDIQPLKLGIIDKNTGTITTDWETVVQVLGWLSTTPAVLYTVNADSRINQIGFAFNQGGQVKMLFLITNPPIVPEFEVKCTLGQQVVSIG